MGLLSKSSSTTVFYETRIYDFIKKKEHPHTGSAVNINLDVNGIKTAWKLLFKLLKSNAETNDIIN